MTITMVRGREGKQRVMSPNIVEENPTSRQTSDKFNYSTQRNVTEITPKSR